MSRSVTRQFLVIATTVLTLVMNSAATLVPLNGRTTAEISDSYPVLFTPAGYVFSIWSVIYLGLIAYTIYQALPSQRENPLLERIGTVYILSGLMNSGWIVLWHYDFIPVSVLVMLALLGLLIAIYLRIRAAGSLSAADTWAVSIPFRVYLGWISVATIANVSVLLFKIGWDGFGISPEAWTVTMLAIGAALGGFFALRRFDIPYVLVLVWAFAGIGVRHQGVLPAVATPALALAGALVLALVVGGVLAGRGPSAAARPA
ncbi:MAG: tryptophan-rich sensory protein [Anaerolineae bacterium]|nr:tryptophan-rich sensory protein [Anaerolineae bacterium]